MRHGCPVVSSDGGSLPEVVGYGGLVLPLGDAAQWADAVQALLTDSSRLAALTTAGKLRAAQFSWEQCARETWQVYRSLGA